MLLGWAANCDPFWSDMNGGCSDEFGNFIQPDGGGSATVNVIGGNNPVLPVIVTKSPTPVIATGSMPTQKRIFAGVDNSALFLVGVGALALMIFAKAR